MVLDPNTDPDSRTAYVGTVRKYRPLKITVEYTGLDGSRACRVFGTQSAAKRFYTAQYLAGNKPKIVRAVG